MKGGWAYALAVFFTLFDALFTLHFWHIEANPIVLGLGPVWFFIAKVYLLVSLGVVWVFLSLSGFKIKGLVDFIIWLYVAFVATVTLWNISQVSGWAL